MMMTLQRAGIVLLLCLVVSCAGKEQPTAPTLTPTDKHPIIVSTDQPTPISTETELPVQMVTPTVDNLLADCWVPTGLTSQISPDGKWIAAPCGLGKSSHLKIVNKHETNIWEPSFQEIAGISPCMGYQNSYGDTRCFDGILQVLDWDKDSRYVFVEVNFLIDRAFDYSFGLYRLDVKTHRISPWLRVGDYTYRFAFSPDNQDLAYISSADVYTLYVNAVETGQVNSYKIPNPASDVAYLAWSPDNQKVAFSILHEGWLDNTGGFSMALLDLEKEKVTVLIPEDKRLFYPTDWSSETVIKLSNRTGLPDYQYDLQTDELSEIP